MNQKETRTAEIVSVGTELLLGQIIDTHAPTMAKILAECGIGCQRRATIGDNFDRLEAALKESLSRADVVVTIGGLGPTGDDLTRDAIAAALGDELVVDEEYAEVLRVFFESRNMPFAESNLKQALRPTSAQAIPNPNGTAPGLLCEKNGKVVIALPGPAGEFNPMANGYVKEYLSKLDGTSVIHSRTLRVVGIGESTVEKMIESLMDGANPTVAPYAHTGEVHLRVTAKADSVATADALIDPVEAQIRKILGNALFGTNETTLEAAVIQLLTSKKQTVAVAESMTGGGLGARLTSVPGSSGAFVGGVIVYSGKAKSAIGGVSESILKENGPVSGEAAIALAENVRKSLGADYGIAITGNAGPGVDVDEKPVGLTFVAISGPHGTHVDHFQYRGIREDIRRRATQLALVQLREELL